MISCFNKENKLLYSYSSEKDFRDALSVLSPNYRNNIDRISLSKDFRFSQNVVGLFSFLKISKLDHCPENFEECLSMSRMFYGCPNLNCDLNFSLKKCEHLLNFIQDCESFNSKITLVNIHKFKIYGILESLSSGKNSLSLEKRIDYYNQFSNSNYGDDLCLKKEVVFNLEKEVFKKNMYNVI